MPKRKDIPKSKQSLQDLIHTPAEQKGKFYMNKNIEFEDAKARIEALLEKSKQEIEKNLKEDLLTSIAYNEVVHHIPEEYVSFEPYDRYLIRFYRRVPIIRVGGLYIPNMQKDDLAKVQINTFTGQVITGKQVKTTFQFARKAVVVSVPSYEKIIQPGDVVAVIPPEMVQETTEYGTFVYYTGWFVHPDAPHTDPVNSPSDVHYGFALYSKPNILGKIGHVDIKPITQEQKQLAYENQ